MREKHSVLSLFHADRLATLAAFHDNFYLAIILTLRLKDSAERTNRIYLVR